MGEIMKNIRIKKKYIVIAVLTLIVSVGTLTFAYFQGNVINDLVYKTDVSTGSIDIKISDTGVNVTDVEPMVTNGTNYDKASFVKHFSVTNGTDTLNTCVELYLRINGINSALANKYFKYAVVNDDTGTAITGDFNEVSSGTELDLGSLYFFEKSTTKNYTMYIWIEYDMDVNQSSMLGKSMSATLFVKAQDSKTKDACDTRETFKLTYVSYGDDNCESANVGKGDSVTLCTPTRTGEEFKGWYTDSKYTNQVTSITNMSDDVKLYAKWNCVFDGDLTQGATYTNGNYTYSYMQQMSYRRDSEISTFFYVPDATDFYWSNITRDGWGVAQTNVASIKTTTDPISDHVCSYINDKPVVSTSYMFGSSNASSIDLSDFNTSTVINMRGMFFNSKATNINLDGFDTSNAVNVGWLFTSSNVKKINVEMFDTSNVTDMDFMFASTKPTYINGLNKLNTSKVTTMKYMFYSSVATSLDLRGFDTSKVTNMSYMFKEANATSLDLSNFVIGDGTTLTGMFTDAKATIGYTKDEATATKFNDSSVTSIPDTLKFTVK